MEIEVFPSSPLFKSMYTPFNQSRIYDCERYSFDYMNKRKIEKNLPSIMDNVRLTLISDECLL